MNRNYPDWNTESNKKLYICDNGENLICVFVFLVNRKRIGQEKYWIFSSKNVSKIDQNQELLESSNSIQKLHTGADWVPLEAESEVDICIQQVY